VAPYSFVYVQQRFGNLLIPSWGW